MFVNTQYFREAALHYLKHGVYTFEPVGSNKYFEFWDEEQRRCLEGYKVGDIWITGNHYAYLNYCMILRTPDNFLITGERSGKSGVKKIKTFPAFWDGDYEFFQAIHKGKTEGRHLVVLKARGKGYSYKAGSLLTNNYFHFRESKSYALVSDETYLIKDGLLSKAWDNISFIDGNTPWTQPKLVDTMMHKMSGYQKNIGGTYVEMGRKSQIIGVSCKNDPDKARGKRGELILFEEAGKFPGLLKAWEVSRPSVEQGAYTTGIMIAFGTGGEEGSNFDGLEELFYNPDSYNCLPFENIWDEGAGDKPCGFFVPEWQNLDGYMDEDGNSAKEKALAFGESERDKKRKGNDPSSLDQYVAEHPNNPREATLNVGNNIFPVKEIMEWKNKIETTSAFQSLSLPGYLYNHEGKIKFKPDNNLRPITKFPLDKKEDTTGCVVVYQFPYKDNGKTPKDLYFICHDPYALDQTTGNSLGAAYVMKRPNKFSQPDDIIVASYIARPGSIDEYNRNLFMLAEYYNAQIGFENDRGDVIGYAKRFKKLDYLAEEFEIAYNKDLVSTKVKRNYGMHMNEKRKNAGMIYLRDWLTTVRSGSAEGETRLNLHEIYDVALLDELRKFDPKGNFDRVSALLIGMYFMNELEFQDVERRTLDIRIEFFHRQLFV